MTNDERAPQWMDRLSQPFLRFLALESASSLLLLGMTIVALIAANSPLAEAYGQVLKLPLAVRIGGFELALSFGHFVNDALMGIFFFVVGMEIKRELAIGELSSLSRALLPAVAALGGMLMPAAIYAAFHWNEPTIRGWGVPMATDIAFALAALSMLGTRVPPGLKVFLLALAIGDDIGAVAVIAIFYTASVSVAWLACAVAGLAVTVLLNVAGVRAYSVYFVVGGLTWLAMHESGVHATIAGVAIGLLTPARPLDPSSDRPALSPIDELTHLLHPWVAFAIMPLFAFCNAGVALDPSSLSEDVAARVSLGIALGLLLGKPIGITLFAWLAVRTGLAQLPRGVRWSHIAWTGFLAGIGFTVALFVASLAFSDPAHGAAAKVGILLGSACALAIGVAGLARTLPRAEASASLER